VDAELDGVAAFAYEMGVLKRARRTGWWMAGVKDPETIGEHSFRTALIGMVLARLEGADPGRTAMLCLLHDTQETRIGDVPLVGRRYVTTAANTAVTADQVAGFPAPVAELFRDVVAEFEAGASAEARVARDADKLEALIQAREYETQGYVDVPAWIETALPEIRTPAGKRLADACLRVPPSQWWRAFGDPGPTPPAPGSATGPQ
jgi:putative hydrolase of HD superfamily